MNKVQAIALSLFIVFFSIAFTLDSWNSEDAHLIKYAQDIENHLHPLEYKVDQMFANKHNFWVSIFESGRLKESEKEKVLLNLQAISKEDLVFFLLEEDSIVFWSKNSVVPENIQEIRPKTKGNTPLVKLGNGYYIYYEESFDDSGNDIRKAVALIPVKKAYSLQSQYLTDHFVANKSIPWQIQIANTETEYPVYSSKGEALFWLKADAPFKDAPQSKLLLFIYILATLSLATFINKTAQGIVIKYQPWWGAAFLIVVVVFLRVLSMQFELTQKFDNLEIFSQAFHTPVLNYMLGDLLIDILILLWLMVFFHREFNVKTFVDISFPWQFSLTALNFFSIILGILMVTSVFHSLVLDSGITFDFGNVFHLNVYSIMAICGVIVLLFALFLFSHRMMLTIEKAGLRKPLRIWALIVAMLFAIPMIWLTDLQLPILQVALVAFLYILLFDLYIENKHPSIIWLGIWVVLFAAFSSMLLFKYNEDKDLKNRITYAQALSEKKDSIAAINISSFVDKVQTDAQLKHIIKDSLHLNTEHIVQRIQNIYSDNNYLFNVYNFEMTTQSHALPDSLWDLDVEQRFNTGKKTSLENIVLWNGKKVLFSYLTKIELTNLKDSSEIEFFFEFEKKMREPSKVYTELILTQAFKNLKNLSKYDFAIYQNDTMIEQSRNIYKDVLDLEATKLPEKGEHISFVNGNRSELIYTSNDDIAVIIGRPIYSLLKPISLFSYLFVLLVITVLLIALINTFTRVLPEALQLTIWRKPSLKNKIQLSVIAVIIFSFVMIGWVTVVYFRNTSNYYHENRLLRKLGSVLMDSEHEIQILKDKGEKEIDLTKLVNQISPIHRMDINIYDLKGDLITSSELDIFNKKIIAPKMGALAYHAIARENQPEFIQEEQIGDLSYKAAYVPLHLPSGQVQGFIGLPYYSKQRNLKDDVFEFMGTLLNVYVFLLLIATSIAIAVANSITKPISVIGEKFKRFKLGNHEPLVWNSKDEIGELIKDYNLMINKVEESTEKLKKSEREGAWRIMAQQVAHEIKNPLTPMKLSIQYLQHKLNNDEEDIKPLLGKVAHTLNEQIDNLTRIASSFSNFAKMPKPENEYFVLNELIESVYVLFGEHSQVNVKLDLPKTPFKVFADKGQLSRVLNNLINNAIQAIPEDRNGIINISLFQKGEMVVIKVSDNGTGISEEMRPKVFVPHFTTKNSGMGLGLAMCKDIVEAAEGNIYFHTIEEQGTDFYIELPLKGNTDKD